MANISKERNFILFSLDDGKTYKFDINEGVLLGVRGKPLRSCPKEVANLIAGHPLDQNVLKSMYYIHEYFGYAYWDMCRGTFIQWFNLADRLQSIGYVMRGSDLNYLRYHYSDVPEMLQNFRQISQCFESNRETECLLVNYKRWIGKEKILQVIGNQYGEHLTDQMISYLSERNTLFSDDDKIKAGAYYLVKGLWNFYHGDTSDISYRFEKYFEWCDKLEWNPKQKGGFLETYVKTEQTYLVKKDEMIAKALLENQSRFADKLAFESDELIVIIPTTPQQFQNEAEQQSNCVYRLYMPECASGNTNVVFIREKSNPEKSYITCEVDNDGDIVQYLAQYNRHPQNERDRKFYDAYHYHLSQVWD